MAERYNTRNPAIKRILQEMKEMQRCQSEDFAAGALEENLFEWNFAIRGAPGTEFEDGIYHGRVMLPAEYPFKPPSFTLLTPNGRFERNTKICLSISSHHPEHWQPSWSIRTALTALIAFMPSPGHGAIGSLDYNADERRDLARKSQAEPPVFGSEERQALMQELHQTMLDALIKARSNRSNSSAAASSSMQVPVDDDSAAAPAPVLGSSSAAGAGQAQPQEVKCCAELIVPQPARRGEAVPNGPAMDPAGLTQVGDAIGRASSAKATPQPKRAPCNQTASSSTAQSSQTITSQAMPRHRPIARQASGAMGVMQEACSGAGWEDKGLLLLAIIFSILIAAILLKKVLVFTGWDMHQSNTLRLSDLGRQDL